MGNTPQSTSFESETYRTGNFSISPDGESFPLPGDEDYVREAERIRAIAREQRLRGRKIVVVMGLGFVGMAMAAVVADTEGGPYFVFGLQRPSNRSYWKIPYLLRGRCPMESEDREVARLIGRCVLERNTLTATYSYEALKYAEIVVVDIQCDFVKEELGNVRSGKADISALEECFQILGRTVQPACLILIETTVPPGTTEYVAYPIIKREFLRRGLTEEPRLAHSFERVMPGRHYLSSIREMWRVCSGINHESGRQASEFLSSVIDVERFPLTVMDRPIESETCKIIENSYRAAILAFMHEWSVFCERNGVDLVKVVDAIRVRPTHSNILFPGPGIGGYCLPKDGALGFWAYRTLMGFEDDPFRITPQAININDTRALHAAGLVRDALRNMGRIVAGSVVAVLGASYREDVGDTRFSGSELLVRKLAEMGAETKVHDPYVEQWWEFIRQDEYPANGRSLARFFRNQEKLASLKVEKDLGECLRGADAVVIAVRHRPYLHLKPDEVLEMVGRPFAVVDCFGVLDDEGIRRYFELGCEVKGLGRGHIQRIKESVRTKSHLQRRFIN